MGVIDVLLAFPGLILALVIAGMLGPGITNVMIAMASVQWVGYARIIRGMVASVKEKNMFRPPRCFREPADFPDCPSHSAQRALSGDCSATLDMGATILAISGMSFPWPGSPTP